MIEAHQRAALIPNAPGVHWHQFLGCRFLSESIGLSIQQIEQHTPEHAELRGLFEHSHGSALPVVTEFTGSLNVDSREIAVHQTEPDRDFSGQFSENGRVLTLRQRGSPKPHHLVHEETLQDLT